MTYKCRHSVWYYMWKSTWDSWCLALACVVFWVSIVILIIYYGFPSIRFEVSWDKTLIDSVNNLTTSVCGGYFITYIFYVLTMLFPFAIKMQHKRIVIEEKARRIKDLSYDLLNGLCEFCSEQTEITNDNLTLFYERNCYECAGVKEKRYLLKQDSKNFLNNKLRCVKEHLTFMEEEFDCFYNMERKILFMLEFASMWQTMEQMNSSVVFPLSSYKDFLNQLLVFYQLSTSLHNRLQDKKSVKLMKCYDIPVKECNTKVCSFITIVNINNK